ncbi:serine hydrolase [Roseateles amylovorans]|uniref:Serine hydrolase n=1 Tax=Roseateles amylovorans TaxID=2978473 RepID=A0ABY6B027_9BURK|nr:serine hydrolase [Roseateles amylovorans]UXH78547.1 serine hydrolase [Roseateles amylovorans]
MTDISRRTGLRATAALTAATLCGPMRAWAQSASSASPAPADKASAADPAASSAKPEPQRSGPDGALLATRLQYQGVALASMRIRDGATTFSAATVQGTLPDDQTLFELGSITKTFTALLLADAVTRGLIKLDDPVETVLPDRLQLRDSLDQPIRWVDLATQRSGLPRLPSNLDVQANTKDPYATYDWTQMATFLSGWKSAKPRDTAYEYSNLGFGLLGQALGFLQKRDYASLLRERVLAPLGLTNDLFLSPPTGRRFLDGHDRTGRPVDHWTFRPAMAPAGALLGTTRGLARYAQAAMGQFEHPLKEAFKLCLRKHGARDLPGSGIGLAWQGALLPGRVAFNHDGATFGFSTTLWLDPTKGNASAVLSNAAIGVVDLGLHLMEPQIPPSDLSLTMQTAITLPAEALKPLAGVYALSPSMKLTVQVDGGRLFARATGQQAFELFAKSPLTFFAKVTPLEIVFEPGDTADAASPALTIKQAGRNTRGVREP